MPIIARDDEEELPLSQHYFEVIERLILSGLIDNREQWRKRMDKLKNNEEADQMVHELEQIQPIMGLEAIPTDVGDAMKAARYAVEKDDFQEWRLKQKGS